MTSPPATPAEHEAVRDSVPRFLRNTWIAAASPVRLVPVIALGGILVSAEIAFGERTLNVILACAMVGAFWLFGPAAYRFAAYRSNAPTFLRVSAFAALSTAVVFGLGVIPRQLGYPATFLTSWPSLFVNLGLFVVGSWGLGRDIERESNLAKAQERLLLLEREAERAELLALRAHLDPHFIFNTLNAIAEWCRQDPQVAEKAIIELANVLRIVMQGVRVPTWPLSKELSLVKQVVELYQLRDAERFVLREAIATGIPNVRIPPLLLLPVIENAMTHGPEAGNAGEITLSVDVRADRVSIQLTNPGHFRGPREGGQGLEMVKKRLVLEYGTRAAFEIESAGEPPRTSAKILLPVMSNVAPSEAS